MTKLQLDQSCQGLSKPCGFTGQNNGQSQSIIALNAGMGYPRMNLKKSPNGTCCIPGMTQASQSLSGFMWESCWPNSQIWCPKNFPNKQMQLHCMNQQGFILQKAQDWSLSWTMMYDAIYSLDVKNYAKVLDILLRSDLIYIYILSWLKLDVNYLHSLKLNKLQ